MDKTNKIKDEKSPSEDTLELHSSHIQMEMEEYDNKIRNQTLTQVEKIIDELEKDELSARVSFACDKLRKEIKNLKEVGK